MTRLELGGEAFSLDEHRDFFSFHQHPKTYVMTTHTYLSLNSWFIFEVKQIYVN